MLETERAQLLRLAQEKWCVEILSNMEASEIVQKTIFVATRDIDSYSGSTEEEFRKWLRCIFLQELQCHGQQSQNTARGVDTSREMPGRAVIGSPSPAHSQNLWYAQSALLDSLQSARISLSPDDQEVIGLRSVWRLSFDEIASRLSQSFDATRMSWCRAIDRLQACLHSPQIPKAVVPSDAIFDQWILEFDKGLDGERNEPPALDSESPALRERIDHARECLLLLDLTRPRDPSAAPLDPIDFAAPLADHHIPVPSRFQRFLLIRSLGSGGFGEVFLADDPLLQRRVAIKIPHLRHVSDPLSRQRFVREARALGQLRHGAIVSVFETGEHKDIPYLVMEYCEAGSLASHLTGLDERPAAQACASIVCQIADGLGQAHSRGILHRDIKPRNILLTRGGTFSDLISTVDMKAPCPLTDPYWCLLHPKLSDFGLAKWFDENGDSDQTQTGAVTGTPRYMSPEQAAGTTDQVCPATDVHGLGLVLYEMLTGQQPFIGDTTAETLWNILNKEPIAIRMLRPAVPRDLETICHKALQKEPGQRYPTAEELAEDLRRFLTDREILAKPVSNLERVWRWCRHHPERTLLLLVVLCSIALISAGGWWYSSQLAVAVTRETELAQFATRLRLSETHLLSESVQRESALLEQAEKLKLAIQRENS